MRSGYPLVVFSHLRWDFVYQRPQHLLSRMAKNRRVIFIEEPVYEEALPYWENTVPESNIVVCRPHTPATTPGFADEQLPLLAGMVPELLKTLDLGDNLIAWLYTPMALPLARTIMPCAVVYDCMDELSAFHLSPPQLLEREAELLEWADVVFTGGPSLYRSKMTRHPNVHCFPSSVDAAHFRSARSRSEPVDQASIPRPRLGYYGVIDERVDPELLDAMSLAHPEWQIIMVGPVVKIDPATLPVRANLHYLGQRQYSDLPSYLGGWDVCIMPFAHNASTRFISPTKTLEYMAAELPIVSTSITDVAEPYGHIVYLGDAPEDFIAACEQALVASSSERQERIDRMRAVLLGTSWDSTANSMEALMNDIVEAKSNKATGPNTAATRADTRPQLESYIQS